MNLLFVYYLNYLPEIITLVTETGNIPEYTFFGKYAMPIAVVIKFLKEKKTEIKVVFLLLILFHKQQISFSNDGHVFLHTLQSYSLPR